MPWNTTGTGRRPSDLVKKHWWSRPRPGVTLHDVYISARLAATHAGSSASTVATLATALQQLEHKVGELTAALGELVAVADGTPVDVTPLYAGRRPAQWGDHTPVGPGHNDD